MSDSKLQRIQPKLDVKGYYSGKNIFLSGCTGFVGKVILEKLLRCCPDINKIYILVRPKRSFTPWDRIKREILNSHCFSVILKSKPDFLAFAESKIIPISGDLIVENLGLSDQDRQMIIENCDILINSAASVNFDDPLQDAIKINYFGSLRMLDLAKNCKKLEVFTHVSTAYVNCTRSGFIREQVYDHEQDSDAIIQHIMKMNPHQVSLKEKQLLGSFPNTYTFTKNMAEKTLLKRKGDLPVVLFRPSIIASSNQQPFPGWTDSLAAAGGLSLLTGLGLVDYVNTSGKTSFDLIPVDFVANGILITTAKQGFMKSKEIDIINCATSVLNPLSFLQYREYYFKASQYFSFNRKVFRINTTYEPNEKIYKLKKTINDDLPIKLYDCASKLPIIGSDKLRKDVRTLKKTKGKVNEILDLFLYFINGDWSFENENIYKVLSMMSPQERLEFNCDCKTIDWPSFIANFLKGLSIWALKEDQVEPIHDMQQLILKNKFLGDDMKLTIEPKINFKNKSTEIYEKSILNEKRFNEFFQTEISNQSISGPLGFSKPNKLRKFDYQTVKNELVRLRCSLQQVPTKASFYLLTKMTQHVVDSLHVDMKSLKTIQNLTKQNRKTRIILMPIYKSYTDPCIMHYVNYCSDQELGFTFGHYEDSHKIRFIDHFLKRIGSLPMSRASQNSISSQSISKKNIDKDVVNYVNQSLFQEVLENNPITTLFQNDERIRSGKINLPLFPDQSINILLKSAQNLKKCQYDIKVVPVCVNYDRLFDSRYLSNEIISGKFQNFNIAELMYYIYKTRPGKLGKTFVKYAEPINLYDYIDKYKDDQKESLSLKLTRDLYHIHQREQPVTMNSLISTSILYNPNSKATFGQIKAVSIQIYKYVQENGIKSFISASPSNYEINQAVLNLGFKVNGKPLDKKYGDQAIVDFEERDSLLKTLSMSYYANQLGVYLNVESILAHSFYYFKKTKLQSKEPILTTEVVQMAKFLEELFKNEFLCNNYSKVNLDQQIDKHLNEAIKIGLVIQNDKFLSQNESDKTNKQKFDFLINLMQPYIDSYFIVALTLNLIMEKRVVIDQQKLVKELHLGIQEMYYKSAIKFMSSCVYDYLNTALGRYSELGICNNQSYDSQDGTVIYLSCPEKNRLTIERYLNILSTISSSDKKDVLKIETQIERVILQAQGPLARL